MAKSANKGKKGSAGSKQNQGNATAKKAKKWGKEKIMRFYAKRVQYSKS